MTPRTEVAAFVLDLMDFIEEKIVEAMENEPSRVAAIGEAAGAIPVLRGRPPRERPGEYAMHSWQHDRAALGVGMVGGLLQDGREEFEGPPGTSSGRRGGLLSC